MKEKEETDELAVLNNVSGLSPDQYLTYYGKVPEFPYKDLYRRRKLFARYGTSSGEDPRIMWPSREELFNMKEEEQSDETPLHEKIVLFHAERDAAECQKLERYIYH